METENLNGTLVLIRPDLENDPAKGQGKVAFIKYVPQQMEGMYVSLLNGQEAFYKPDELLRLKDKNELFRGLMDNGTSLDVNDFKALYKISLLQDKGTSTALVQALEIARDNPSVWPRALDSLAPEQNLELAKSYSR
jgi:hypothetical protein